MSLNPSFQHFDNALLEQHLALSAKTLPGPDYYTVLQWIHQILQPANYVEIGIRQGASMRLARPGTICVGIDPEPAVPVALPPEMKVFALTSDDFFAQQDLPALLNAPSFALAFIDGLHLFEQALKDFINLEKFAGPGSIIMLHDCLPLDGQTSDRERSTHFYSGDPWKAVLCLKNLRPDLMIKMVRTGPTGLCLIGRLDKHSTVLASQYDAIISEYTNLTYADYQKHLGGISDTVENSPQAISDCIAELKG